jgi:hypothetical protein
MHNMPIEKGHIARREGERTNRSGDGSVTPTAKFPRAGDGRYRAMPLGRRWMTDKACCAPAKAREPHARQVSPTQYLPMPLLDESDRGWRRRRGRLPPPSLRLRASADLVSKPGVGP